VTVDVAKVTDPEEGCHILPPAGVFDLTGSMETVSQSRRAAVECEGGIP
jgi:hypothetical protein